MRVFVEKYEAFCQEACIQAGYRPEVANAVAHYLVRTDMMGIHSHGTLNLLPYLEKTAAGGICRDAAPELVHEGPAWAVLEGHNGMGPYNARCAMEIGMKKAKQTGLAYVMVRNSSHYGACGVYAVEGAEQGFITLTATNVAKTMTVPGGKGGIIGNSPFAYAVPAGNRHPSVFLDVATSNIAGMKVNRAKTAGEQVPPGCIVDENGLPTTDPNTDWALYPLGGHKGYGIAFFIEVLTSVLSGGQILDIPLWIRRADQLCPYSHMFLFIDTYSIMGADSFADRIDFAVEEIANAPKAAGSDHIYLPGEMEWDRHDRAQREGLVLPKDVEDNAKALASRYSLDLNACIR